MSLKLNAQQTKDFWQLAQSWAGSTLDTPKRAAALLEFVEGLMTEAAAQRPPILWGHGNEAAQRSAEDALTAIDAALVQRECRRKAAEQRSGVDRRSVSYGVQDDGLCRVTQPFVVAQPRSEDMREAANAQTHSDKSAA